MKSELQKAVALYEKCQLSDAKKIALNIYNNKPNYFDNLLLLNFICYKKKDFSTALNFINEAIKINLPNLCLIQNFIQKK